MSPTIRPATAEDWPHLHRINREALDYDYTPQGTREQLARVLANPVYRVLVAVLAGEVVGYIQAGDYDTTYAPPYKNVLAIAVCPRHQGRGIGRLLLQAAEAWARETGAQGIRLNSSAYRVKAHRFYTACGYQETKTQVNFRIHF